MKDFILIGIFCLILWAYPKTVTALLKNNFYTDDVRILREFFSDETFYINGERYLEINREKYSEAETLRQTMKREQMIKDIYVTYKSTFAFVDTGAIYSIFLDSGAVFYDDGEKIRRF